MIHLGKEDELRKGRETQGVSMRLGLCRVRPLGFFFSSYIRHCMFAALSARTTSFYPPHTSELAKRALFARSRPAFAPQGVGAQGVAGQAMRCQGVPQEIVISGASTTILLVQSMNRTGP